MKISKFLKGMLMVTALSLVYIHMQMQIFDLAYQAKRKEQFMKRLMEDQGNMTYEILKLKSSHNLGQHMLSDKTAMRFVDNSQIVRLESRQALPAQSAVALPPNESRQRTNPILSFLSLRSQAEAKSQE